MDRHCAVSDRLDATSRRLARALARQGRKGEGSRYARRAVEIYPPLRLLDLAAAQGAIQQCER